MSESPLIKRILFATDFSEAASVAQEHACQIADKLQCELHLLHVVAPVPMPSTGTPTFGYMASSSAMAEIEKNTLQSLQELLDPEWQTRHNVIKAVRVGMAVPEILRYADENQIDMIVLGTLGRTGLTHLLLGSVAEMVVRKASCPVLTVSPRTEHGSV